MKFSQRTFPILLFSVITLTLVLNLGQYYSLWNLAGAILLASRWLTMAMLVVSIFVHFDNKTKIL